MGSKEPAPEINSLKTYIYASPDGQDCLKKTAHSVKLAGIFGLYVSVFDIVGITRPKGFMAVSGRMLAFGIPAAAAGGTFAATTCLLGDLRGKNDTINHAVGGLLGGAIVGPRIAGPWGAMAIALGLSGVAALVKLAKNEGIMIVNRRVGVRESYMKGGIFGPRNRVAEPTDY